ncbi:hypothetical protein HQ590_09370, partial [bacterium]|nr:hypothetical protein [bacterium]
MIPAKSHLVIALCALVVGLSRAAADPTSLPTPPESIWIEAEHLNGVAGYCWPMGPAAGKETKGRWAFSGPGWAAEWNQGGESGFQSIACGPADDQAVATRRLEIPVAGTYRVWVRYGDWREKSNRFRIRLEQPGRPVWEATYGEAPLFDEDNVMKLFWGWAFGWESQEVPLQKGEANLSLLAGFREEECRQLDVIVLTTDASYRPYIKERPRNYAWEVLQPYLTGFPAALESLSRNRPKPDVPAAWVPRTFRDKGFLYVQEVGSSWLESLSTNAPDRVLFPFNLGDNKDVIEEFAQKYGGKQQVPIFADPRVTPRVHGPGPILLQTDSANETVKRQSQAFVQWLDDHPDRCWATVLNYHPLNYNPVPYSRETMANYFKYRDRFVGNISGENLGYYEKYVDPAAVEQVGATAQTRRELIERLSEIDRRANDQRWRSLFGPDTDRCGNLYTEIIPAGIAESYYPICYAWGARAVGTEMVAVTGCMQGMYLALLRGAARQNNGMIFTYRSGNFGDGSATFEPGTYATTKQILDNYYSPYSGAGMTWWKFDGWYMYMAGSAMFQQESSRDNFWKPGGLTAAGVHEVQL